MEQQFKYLVEELHRGEWNPFMVKDKNGNKVQKRVFITEEQAERNNVYSKDYKLRYIKADEVISIDKNANEDVILDEKTELQDQYKEKFGKKAFHGWGVEELKEKLNE